MLHSQWLSRVGLFFRNRVLEPVRERIRRLLGVPARGSIDALYASLLILSRDSVDLLNRTNHMESLLAQLTSAERRANQLLGQSEKVASQTTVAISDANAELARAVDFLHEVDALVKLIGIMGDLLDSVEEPFIEDEVEQQDWYKRRDTVRRAVAVLNELSPQKGIPHVTKNAAVNHTQPDTQ